MSERQEVGINELATSLADGLKDADRQRTSGLGLLMELRLARAEGRRRERNQRARLRPDDPRLAALDARIAEDTEVAAGLYLEALRSTAPRVEPEEGVWQLHGRLVAPPRELPKGAMASLLHRNGRPVSGVEDAPLDERGFFLLRYQVPAAPEPDPKAAGRGAARQAAAAKEPPQVAPVILRIAGADGGEIVRHSEPFQPEAGVITYVEIPLFREEGRAAEPETRAQTGSRTPPRSETTRGRPRGRSAGQA